MGTRRMAGRRVALVLSALLCFAGAQLLDDGADETSPNSTVGMVRTGNEDAPQPSNRTADKIARGVGNVSIGEEPTVNTTNPDPDCSVGFYKLPGSLDCTECEAGVACNGTIKMPCPRGNAQPQAGQQNCVPCDAGSYANVTGSKACRPCPAGSFCNNTREVPKPCPLGTGSNASATECSECPAGEYGPGGGCKACDVGTYQVMAATSECLPCPAGSKCPKPEQRPMPCKPGSYQNEEGAETCKPCAAGTSAPGVGATMCSKCPLGAVAEQEGLANCTTCALGSFSAVAGGKLCIDCPKGRSCGAPNVSATPCPLGMFSSATGAAKCKPCSPKFYADDIGMEECKKCT